VVSYDETSSLVSSQRSVRDKIDDQANEKRVKKLLMCLNISQRACIVLRSIEGLSYKEIADTLSIPINTVRSRIKRARESMLVLGREVIPNGL